MTKCRDITLSLDDDVLLAVKGRARRERRSVGAVLSELARQALSGGPVSNAVIDLLREDEPE